MSVNDLVEHWNAFAEKLIDDAEAAGVAACAEDIGDVASAAWHPVSESPTEADADDWGFVAFLTDEGFVVTEPHWEAPGVAVKWARIRDVVLMPPQGGE